MKNKQKDKLEVLRDLLVDDVIEQQENIILELRELQNTLNKPDLLKEKINIILNEQKQEMKQKFDHLFGQEVATIIKNSEPQLIKALTPIMGKLIHKWIAFELIKVQDKVNNQLKNNPISSLIGKIRGRNADKLLANVNTAAIKDILIVEKKSGLLICNYALENPINKNQVGGLLAAIKAFGEDALKVGYKEEIEELRFETYKVIIHNDFDYFAAILLNGVPNPEFTIKLKNTLGYFISNNISNKDFTAGIPEKELSEKLRNALKKNKLC